MSKEKVRYMMAKDIAGAGRKSQTEDLCLCVIYEAEEEDYIGWLVGDMENVRFPKKTTRELTDEEEERCHRTPTSLGW